MQARQRFSDHCKANQLLSQRIAHAMSRWANGTRRVEESQLRSHTASFLGKLSSIAPTDVFLVRRTLSLLLPFDYLTFPEKMNKKMPSIYFVAGWLLSMSLQRTCLQMSKCA